MSVWNKRTVLILALLAVLFAVLLPFMLVDIRNDGVDTDSFNDSIKDTWCNQTELEDFSYYLNTSSVNISCENNLSFYSEDYSEKYEFKCVDGGVRVFLPKFNLTKNTTMWMYYGDEPMNLRRIVTVTPYQLYEEIIYDDFEEYVNWTEVI